MCRFGFCPVGCIGRCLTLLGKDVVSLRTFRMLCCGGVLRTKFEEAAALEAQRLYDGTRTTMTPADQSRIAETKWDGPQDARRRSVASNCRNQVGCDSATGRIFDAGIFPVCSPDIASKEAT